MSTINSVEKTITDSHSLKLGDLLSEIEVAALLGLQPATLRRWRVVGYPLPFVKVGRLVRYRRTDVAALVEAGSRASTSTITPTNTGTLRA